MNHFALTSHRALITSIFFILVSLVVLDCLCPALVWIQRLLDLRFKTSCSISTIFFLLYPINFDRNDTQKSDVLDFFALFHSFFFQKSTMNRPSSLLRMIKAFILLTIFTTMLSRSGVRGFAPLWRQGVKQSTRSVGETLGRSVQPNFQQLYTQERTFTNTYVGNMRRSMVSASRDVDSELNMEIENVLSSLVPEEGESKENGVLGALSARHFRH